MFRVDRCLLSIFLSILFNRPPLVETVDEIVVPVELPTSSLLVGLFLVKYNESSNRSEVRSTECDGANATFSFPRPRVMLFEGER